MEAPSSREKILDQAEARFAQRGYMGVGLRELAEASGLGKSSLFHHFPSKAHLYLAVLERVLARIALRLDPIFQSGAAPGERLDRAVDGLVDVLAEHPSGARLLLRALFEEDDLPVDELEEGRAAGARVQSLVGGLHALIEQGVAEGDFAPVSATHTVQTLIGATVYHFASGEFGEELMRGSLFSGDAVRLRKQEIRNLLHRGLFRPRDSRPEETPS